jgi:multisubunit Na+/H+ antiporter MnhF subunit
MAAGIAAPLLAGISFTLVVLTLQMRTRELRFKDAALFLFILGGLSFITTVQAAMWEHRYRRSSTERAKWERLARDAYHVGILGLLAAMAILLIPRGPVPATRLATIALVGVGFAAELWWIGLAATRQRRANRRMAQLSGRRH